MKRGLVFISSITLGLGLALSLLSFSQNSFGMACLGGGLVFGGGFNLYKLSKV